MNGSSGAPTRLKEGHPVQYSGKLERQTPTGVAGSCSNLSVPGEHVDLELRWGSYLLRKFSTNGKRFHFGLDRRLTALLPQGTVLTLRLPDGTDLASGDVTPIGDATDGGEKLRKQIDSGYIVDKWGALKLPFSAKSPEDRAKYAKGMADLAAYFRAEFEKILFPHYGTLLGYARSRQFIPHDDDTDMSYISTAETIGEAIGEFFDMMKAIRAAGHKVWVVDAGQSSVSLSGENHYGADIFLSWLQPNGTFFTYFGVLGQLSNAVTFNEDKFEGVTVNIPTNYENILELTYGLSWRVPDPNFRWQENPRLATMVKNFRDSGELLLRDFRQTDRAKALGKLSQVEQGTLNA